MLILNADDVRQSLSMSEAVAAMKLAFAALSDGRAVVPQRVHLPIKRNNGISLFMPAFVDDPDPDKQALTIKSVSLFDENLSRGLARIQAAVLVLAPDTGQPTALLEGATLTAIRTAAASGAATDLLARQNSTNLAILGAGVQARSHLAAMCAVRPIESVRVYSLRRSKVQALIDEFSRQSGFAGTLRVATSPSDAIANADIICATTTSSNPVFSDGDVKCGAHINAVGSYTPQAREVPAETVVRSFVVVDDRAAAWQEAGDLIQPFQAGLIERDHVRAEVGELVLKRHAGRTNDLQITFFKSVGSAVQDAFAARTALDNAQRRGLGQSVRW